MDALEEEKENGPEEKIIVRILKTNKRQAAEGSRKATNLNQIK